MEKGMKAIEELMLPKSNKSKGKSQIFKEDMKAMSKLEMS